MLTLQGFVQKNVPTASSDVGQQSSWLFISMGHLCPQYLHSMNRTYFSAHKNITSPATLTAQSAEGGK